MACIDFFKGKAIEETVSRPPGAPPPATPEQSQRHTEAVNKSWERWLSEKGRYSGSEQTNRWLIANLKKAHPEFYSFLEFVSPGFPNQWSSFETIQQRYVEFQKKHGRQDVERFRMVVSTKLRGRNKTYMSRELPHPSAINNVPIHSSDYLTAFRSLSVPIKYSHTTVSGIENFSLLHDMAHAFAFTHSRFVAAVLKMTPEVIRILKEDLDRGMGKHELLSQVLEDYWELKPTDQARVVQLMAPIKPIMERLEIFYSKTNGYSRENVTLLSAQEANLLRSTFLQIRQIVNDATLIRFGAAVIEGIAIDRWNYEMSRHGNPLTFLKNIESHPFFEKAIEPQNAGSFFRDVGYFLSRQYGTLVELETRSLNREIEIVLRPSSE